MGHLAGSEATRSFRPLFATITACDASGNVTRYGYDRHNRLVIVTDPLRAVTTSAYDLVGNKTKETDRLGRVRLYADIAHPINASCRELIQTRIVREYEAELVRAKQPGYMSRYDAIGDEERR